MFLHPIRSVSVRSMSFATLVVAVGALLTAGCVEPSCTVLPPPFALVVLVRDSVTELPAAAGAYATARAPDTLAVLERVDSLQFGGVHLPGRYSVAVSKPDYQPWLRANVAVKTGPDGCGLVVVRLTALLQPL